MRGIGRSALHKTLIAVALLLAALPAPAFASPQVDTRFAALLRTPVQESTGRAAGVAGRAAGQVAQPLGILVF